ncbi:DNA gyrase subunit A [Actinomarinicola tropica]|uniref:DNA gyrase subunit A n=1 Tax=Actinomarinicola tropica TaxID=2789776 RepID=A0A5Q2RH47_9ACTN|nr:DNA gyrase subunit A [Actinomarinicola tropica]QGG93626.1 DNA gyrase subunit A [Actinomarinicola tropica]
MADDDQTPTPEDPTPTPEEGGLSADGALAAIVAGSVEPIEIEREMEQSFLEYAMSVIIARALPDARDGLKPVHRRILWAMSEGGLRPDRSHVKCATVVGDVLGKYHPHGDQSVYDALVRMGQPFSIRHTLIDPHGNFGSPSDPPAAYRYTECRLSPIAMQLLADIDEDTVDFSPNFDGRHDEPDVLPARFPNLLVNGSQGIAVGMATNIPPHNLDEVVDAVVHLLANPEATTDELMAFVKGPDFPTGGKIMGRSGIASAYRTGRGSIRIRATAEIEEHDGGDRIVVTEIPYQTSIEQIEQKTAELVEKREIEGIRAIRNESAKGVTKLVFELKRDAPALVILNNLYKHTPLQVSFGVNMVALVDGVPRTLTLRDALVAYVEHQVEVITRRSEFRLAKAQARAHIVEGLIKALDLIDQIIATIRASEDRAAARESLTAAPFEFSVEQADHILEMQLVRLTRLGRANLETELAELREKITELEAILADEGRLRNVIRDELVAVRDAHATPRVCQLAVDYGDLDIEDLIDDEEVVVTLSEQGYVKTVSIDAFRTQGRGGRGVAGAKLKDEDFVNHVIHTTAHAYLLFFSNRGRVYRLKAHQIPMMERTARGTAIVNLLQLQPDEHIQALIDTRDYETNRYLFFATRQGQVKKTSFTDYDSSLRAGLIALNLRDGDELVAVFPTNGEDDILMTSRNGQTIRFAESEVRPMGRAAAGVRGMRLRDGDVLVAADAVRTDADYVIVTDAGYGKRTAPDRYPRKGRGTQGVKGIALTEQRGEVIAAFMASPEDQLVVVSSNGVLIRTLVGEISEQGRSATGVRVMNLPDGDRVASVAPVTSTDADDDVPLESPDTAPADADVEVDAEA